MSLAGQPGGVTGRVDDILITEELDRRPGRAPDHAAETRAVGALAQEMATSPGTVLQKLTDLMVEFGWAQSAGASILEPHDPSTFRWQAVSGLWAEHVGGTMPLSGSPCGVVVARDSPLLFARPHEHFPAANVEPLIREILLVPFHVAGRPAGTIWAVTHDDARRFDNEDLRVLTSLAHFASAAHQMNGALAEARDARADLERRVEERTGELSRANERLAAGEARLAADLAGMRRLHGLHAKLAGETDLHAALREILAAAVEFTGTDRGCVQLISGDGERLEMFAHHGYGAGSGFIDHFMHEGSKPACDAARRQRQRLVIEDVEAFPGLAGTKDREVALAEGIRATQSTPMVSRKGELVGVLSTQFRQPHAPADHELRLVDMLAWSAAEFVERHRADAALRESEARLAADLAAMRELQRISGELVGEHDPKVLYGWIVEAAAKLMRSDAASLQELHAETGRLELLAWRGFHPESAAFWRWVRADTGSSCGRALAAGERIIVSDMDRFDGEPEDVDAYRRSGLLSVVSSPLLAHSGRIVGMLSTHWRDRRTPSDDEYRLFDVLARLAADLIERVQVGERLRQSEERFRIIVESARDYAIFVIDPERRVVSWPGGAEAVFGWSAEEIVGRPADVLFTPEDREAAQPERETAVARDTGHAPDVRWHMRKDGSRVFIEGSTRPLSGPGGELRGFVKIGQDVTERRRTEEALRESEERFRQFGEASSDALWIRDAGTLQWEYLSPAFEAIYGMRLEDALAADNLRTWADLIVEEDRGRALACIARVRGGERVRFEYRVRRPDGGVRWLRDTDFPMRGRSGAVERIGGVGQDVTELKRIEAALRDEEARQRALVEGIPQLVWRSAAAGRWSWAGRQWTAYTGLSGAASRDLGWLGALHPEDRGGAVAAWERATEAGGLFEADYRLRSAADGVWRWFQGRGVPVRREDGGIAEWIGTSTDIEDMVRAREVLARGREELEALVAARTAELTAAEETLRQAQKMEAVGQLTGGIAHDFNNMLQGVSGAVEMARRRMEAGRPDEAKRYLDAAREAASRAAGLTLRLLAFARRQRLEPKPVDPDALVTGLADLVRRTVGPGITVELELRDGAGSVLCDPNELESALLNLCINARDAMPEGGKLAIGTEDVRLSAADVAGQEGAAPGGYVAIWVADTGSGMSPEVLGRVFEPFFTTKPLGQGTGLGLSQVYGFVRQSGGLVRIESAPGRGTAVRLLLPRHERAVETAEEWTAPAVREGAGAGAAVLLVDDEAAVRRPAAERLRELGFRVLEAADGPSALRLLGDDAPRPELLVTDVGLPNGMNGRQVAEAARERWPGLPVLFITGYAGTWLPPGVEVIGKPFGLDALARRVQEILKAGRQDPEGTLGA